MRIQRLLLKVRANPNNVRFGDLARLALAFGFRLERISGSHHIYGHPLLPELLNLQSANGKAKPYQVRQFLDLVARYNLSVEGEG